MNSFRTFLGKLKTQVSILSCEGCGAHEEVITHALPEEGLFTAKNYLCTRCTMKKGCRTKR